MKRKLASVFAVLLALPMFAVKEPAHAFKFFHKKKAPVKVENPVVQPEAVKPVTPAVTPAVTPVVKPEVKPAPCAKKVAPPCAKKPVPAAKKAVPAKKPVQKKK